MVAASIPVRYNSILPRKKEHATKRSIALLLAEDAPFDTGIFAVLGEPMNTLRCWPALRVSPPRPDKVARNGGQKVHHRRLASHQLIETNAAP
jgi:hypothetical protein